VRQEQAVVIKPDDDIGSDAAGPAAESDVERDPLRERHISRRSRSEKIDPVTPRLNSLAQDRDPDVRPAAAAHAQRRAGNEEQPRHRTGIYPEACRSTIASSPTTAGFFRFMRRSRSSAPIWPSGRSSPEYGGREGFSRSDQASAESPKRFSDERPRSASTFHWRCWRARPTTPLSEALASSRPTCGTEFF